MFIYLLLTIALIYIAFLVYDINVNDPSYFRKRIDEDATEDQNTLKPFQY